MTENLSSDEWLSATTVTSYIVRQIQRVGFEMILSSLQADRNKMVCLRFKVGAEQHFRFTLESFFPSHN